MANQYVPSAFGAGQYLKASGTGTSADPFAPEVTAVPAVKVVEINPPLDTAIYAAGDLLFDSVVISNAARAVGGYCVLTSVTVIDKADISPQITLVVADSMLDFGTVNTAPSLADADAGKICGSVAIVTADYIDIGGSRVATKGNLNIVCKAPVDSAHLALAGLVTTGTPTFGATDLTVKLGFVQA